MLVRAVLEVNSKCQSARDFVATYLDSVSIFFDPEYKGTTPTNKCA